MILVYQKELECLHLSIHLDLEIIHNYCAKQHLIFIENSYIKFVKVNGVLHKMKSPTILRWL